MMTPCRAASVKESYDVIVVGCGPAGAAFIRQLENRNCRLSVLVLDKQSFPRDKVCGDAISVHSLEILHRIFPESRGPFPSSALSHLITVVFPNGTRIRLGRSTVDVIPRLQFDTFLRNSLAVTDADILEHAKVIDLSVPPAGRAAVTVEVDDQVRQFNANLVLGADGSSSLVRRKTGSVEDDLFVVPVRQYVKDIPRRDDGLVIIMDPPNQGYFWIFPFQRDTTQWANVGYGSRKATPRRRFEALCNTPLVRHYLGDGTFQGKIKGFPLNMAATQLNRLMPHRSIAGPGYLLLGDAACLAHPHTGEGISAALFSGGLAADLLADGLAREDLAQAYQTKVFQFLQSAYHMRSSSMLFAYPCIFPAFLSGPYVKLLRWQHHRDSAR